LIGIKLKTNETFEAKPEKENSKVKN